MISIEINFRLNHCLTLRPTYQAGKSKNIALGSKYCFDWKNLNKYLLELTPQNAQGEYYLTDTIQMFVNNSMRIE